MEKQPSVKNLLQLYESKGKSVSDHLEEIPAELGAQHYKQAKKRTLTLSKKREKSVRDLTSLFEKPKNQPEEQQSVNSPKVERDKTLKNVLTKLLELDAESSQIGSASKPVVKEEWAAKKSLFEESEQPSNKTSSTESEPIIVSSEASTLAQKLAQELEISNIETEGSQSITLDDLIPPSSELEDKSQSSEVLTEEERQESTPNGGGEENLDENFLPATKLLIKSNKDVAEILIDVVHEVFYNPKSGFWKNYDASFDRTSFTKYGKEGWDQEEDTPQRLAARDDINHQKNLELDRVLETEFCVNAIDLVATTMETIIQGVKKKDVKKAIRYHVRDHLSALIYLSK